MPKKKLLTGEEKENIMRRARELLARVSPDFREIFQDMEEGEAVDRERREGTGWYGRVASEGRDWRPFAPVPTLLCRLSPFFPLGPRQLRDRPVFRNMVMTREVGDRIGYHGPQLSTYEEDVLIPLLGLLNNGVYRLETEVERRPTFTYQGPLRPILRLMGRSGGAGSYKRTRHSLKLMNQAGIELTLGGTRYAIDKIVSQFSIDPVSKKAAITLHPFFYEACGDGQVTLLDAVQRAGLSRPISKALYRFIMMHSGSIWRGYFMHLVPPLNLNPQIPPKTIRSYLKAAIAELQTHGIVDPTSGFENKNIVRLARYRQTENVGMLEGL